MSARLGLHVIVLGISMAPIGCDRPSAPPSGGSGSAASGAASPGTPVPSGSAPAAASERAAAPASGLTWCEVLEAEPDPAVVTDPALRAAIKATGKPWRVRDVGTGIELLLIPPGMFVMGKSLGDEQTFLDELPAHEVTLTDPYYLGRFEVTQSQWVKVMGRNPSTFVTVPDRQTLVSSKMQAGMTQREAEAAVPAPTLLPDRSDKPVEGVSWEDAAAFCGRASVRLPTEAEWEHACRAGLRTARYGDLDRVAWHRGNSGMETHTVGGKAANGFGLHDMLGNVWEWVNDWHGTYPSDAQTNPTGPGNAADRVIRGGSWNGVAANVRSSGRGLGPPGARYSVGFRVARTP